MIYQYNSDEELIGTFETLAKASESTGLGKSTIHDSISGKHVGRHGFIFLKNELTNTDIKVDLSNLKTVLDKIENVYKEKYIKNKNEKEEIDISKTEINDNEYVTDVTSDAFKLYCINEGIDISKVKSAKYVNHQGQKAFNVVLDYNTTSEKDYLDIRDEIIVKMDKHSPKYPLYKKRFISTEQHDNYDTEGRMLVLGLSDLHLNQLSSITEVGKENGYNTNIAVTKTLKALSGLLNDAKGFAVTDVLVPLGGDVLNTDTVNRTTTSGTAQDTDLMWYDAFSTARDMYIIIIDCLLEQGYNIHIKHIPSNHDYMTGYMLADTIKSWYRHTDIEFDVDMTHRKYFTFGKNLIGITHGDSAKKEKLSALMSVENKDWSSSDYRYIYTQHIHHKTVSVDEIGVTIESLRSPVSPSGWAHRNGYVSQKGLGAFIHDKKNGQIAKLIYNFK